MLIFLSVYILRFTQLLLNSFERIIIIIIIIIIISSSSIVLVVVVVVVDQDI